jgi:PKD repeat protein
MTPQLKFLICSVLLLILIINPACNKDDDEPELTPYIDFEASPIQGNSPLTVIFHNTSDRDITDWYWDFGDSHSSAEKHPVHIYENPGKYTVSLMGIINRDSFSISKEDLVIVIAPNVPNAYFGVDNHTGLAISDVFHFTDESLGLVDSWHWDFGDGRESSAQNPTHVYTSAGIYTVVLTVSGPGGSSSITTQVVIDEIRDFFIDEIGPFWPSKVEGQGDCNFAGNDVEFIIKAEAMVPRPWEVAYDLELRLAINIWETTPDYTAGQGFWVVNPLELPANMKVKEWIGPVHMQETWTDTDSDYTYDYSPSSNDPNELCNFVLMADTPGNDLCGTTLNDTHFYVRNLHVSVRIGPIL